MPGVTAQKQMSAQVLSQGLRNPLESDALHKWHFRGRMNERIFRKNRQRHRGASPGCACLVRSSARTCPGATCRLHDRRLPGEPERAPRAGIAIRAILRRARNMPDWTVARSMPQNVRNRRSRRNRRRSPVSGKTLWRGFAIECHARMFLDLPCELGFPAASWSSDETAWSAVPSSAALAAKGQTAEPILLSPSPLGRASLAPKRWVEGQSCCVMLFARAHALFCALRCFF